MNRGFRLFDGGGLIWCCDQVGVWLKKGRKGRCSRENQNSCSVYEWRRWWCVFLLKSTAGLCYVRDGGLC